MTDIATTLARLPAWFWTFVAVSLGAVWASFLNVVIYRVPRGKSIVYPGSACPACQAPIAWYDNVPVLSWLVLGGKCRRCKAPISARYPLVELCGALLSAALIHRFGPTSSFVVYFVFTFLLLAIAFIDLDTWLIPDVLSLPGIAVGIAGAFLLPQQPWLQHVLGAAVGGGLFWGIAVISAKVLKKEGMGFGDVKLLAMIGAFLGLRGIPFVILLASLQGAVIGALWVYINRNAPPPAPQDDGFVPPKNAVPFGPFLALGAMQTLFFGAQLEVLFLRLRM